MAALAKAEPKCSSGKVTEYAWHIHTKWQQPATYTSGSASFVQCAKAITANHYDPYRSCGPASDFADAPECAGRPANYKCTPDNYKKDPWLCEVGDLSGKFGRFKPNKKGEAAGTWTDKNFPTWLIKTTGWNVVVHAVCAEATPRIACAQGYLLNHKLQSKKDVLGKDQNTYGDGDSHKSVVAQKDEAEESEDDSDSANAAGDVHAPESNEHGNKHLRISISLKNEGD